MAILCLKQLILKNILYMRLSVLLLRIKFFCILLGLNIFASDASVIFWEHSWLINLHIASFINVCTFCRLFLKIILYNFRRIILLLDKFIICAIFLNMFTFNTFKYQVDMV